MPRAGTGDPELVLCLCGARRSGTVAASEESASASRRPFCPVSRGGAVAGCGFATLYLRGVQRGLQEALEALLGKDASGLSAQVIGRLKAEWEAEHERWRRRDLSATCLHVGRWHLSPVEDEKQCVGATPEGRKELVGFQAGVRESAQSWRELLACLRRGLTIGPELAIGDGALGFWKALEEIFPDTRRQRCWVHKTANVLNKLAKSRKGPPKLPCDIWMADGRAEAERAMNTFAAKLPPSRRLLDKGPRYDFPAEHWRHIRTTNPIESVFATVRHRTVRTKGLVSGTTLAMVFKLITTASKTWRRLMGNNQLPKVIEGVRFKDGMQIDETKTRAAA